MPKNLMQLIYERGVARRREYRVYTASPEQPEGTPDPRVEVFDAARPPTDDIVELYQRHAGRRGAFLMFGRLRRQGAVLLVLREGDALKAFGWLQSLRCLQREFWWLPSGAICLGPFWTHPDHRGKGLYGMLLSASLHECRARCWKDVYIWAQSDNVASTSGIEKAGFRFLGSYKICTYFWGCVRRHRKVG
jgi:GNAT superfamily N-acetyltransferase